MVVGLGVHPFIITLGTMWIFRGVAFVASKAETILVPDALTRVAKASLGLPEALYPVPLLAMLAVMAVGSIYLTRTVMGRHVFAIGGNVEASRFSGLHLPRITLGVYLVVRADRRARRLPGRELLRLGLLRRRHGLRALRHRLRGGGRGQPHRRARAARSRPCWARCSSSSSASPSAPCTSTRTTSGSSSAARSSSRSCSTSGRAA